MFPSRTMLLSYAAAAGFLLTLTSSLCAATGAGSASGTGTGTGKTVDILLSDFEGSNYGKWIAEGKAFQPGPQDPEKIYLNRMNQRLAMSRLEYDGDGAVGTLTSPEFVMERQYLSFLIGGGYHPGATCVELVIEGETVRSQTGHSPMDKTLKPVFWDLREYKGKTARIRIADRMVGRVRGSWGHIAADFFILTDQLPQGEKLLPPEEFAVQSDPAKDRMLADFELPNYGLWKPEGLAFGMYPRPAEEITGGEGKGYASSRNAHPGVRENQGSLTSPEFVIDRDYLNFKIAGGDHAFRAAITLWLDGQVVRTSTGRDQTELKWETWDVRDLKGKTVMIGIYDHCVEDLPGYIMVDSIHLGNTARGPLGGNVESAMQQVRQEALAAIQKNAPQAAQDPWRPIYHYLPPSQNMNDPNGPAWHDGWHHVFFQYAVFSPRRVADMHWGHARSRDLVNWETLPLAIYPSYEQGERSVYTGNMVRDKNGDPVQLTTMVPYKPNAWRRIWTARPVDAEWIHWQKSPTNPPEGLVPFGDPKRNLKDPFPFIAGDRRFTVLTDQTLRTVVLYEALDDKLEKWTFRGDLRPEGTKEDECPNLFEVDGHWLYLSSPHDQPRYEVGTFDPVSGRFTAETEGRLNHSADYFAPDAPKNSKPNTATGYYASTAYRDDKGRTILLGISKRIGGKNWTGALTLPRVLTIGPDKRPRMHPLPELQSLRGTAFNVSREPLKLTNHSQVIEGLSGDAVEIIARFKVDDAQAFGLRVRRSQDGKEYLPIEWRGGRVIVIKENQKHPISYEIDPETKEIVFHIFLDKGMLDAITGDGKVFESRIHDAPLQNLGVEVFAEEGTATLVSLQAWQMNAATIDHSRLFSGKQEELGIRN